MEKNNFLIEVGEKIKQQRKILSLNQTDLGYHQTQFARYERGEITMNIINLKNICEKLQLSADYLLDLPNEFDTLSDEKKVNYLMMKKLSRDNDLKLTGMILAMLEQQKDHE